jgi:DNA invertase Pin-like site-specific DNA recombinase
VPVGFLSEIHSLGIDLYLHQQVYRYDNTRGQGDVSDEGVFAEFERAMIQQRVVLASVEPRRKAPSRAT